MQFTVNTKPLVSAVNLGVVNANISNYHRKSTIAQITATKDTLKINIEADMIKTELTLKGSGDEDGPEVRFVGSALFKQLIGTLETSTITLDFVDGGLTIISGTSKFTIPKMFDFEEVELDAPATADGAVFSKITQENWKYIKDNQMFAIAMSFVYPVYTKVWMSNNKDVLVCDSAGGLFTYSAKGDLTTTCLLSDTIINLFTVLPEDAQIANIGRDYIISAGADSFTYRTQFSPSLESDEGMGDYLAPMYIEMMKHRTGAIKFKASVLSKYLSQAELLNSASNATVNITIDKTLLTMSDNNVNCKIPINGAETVPVDLVFSAEKLRSVMSNFGDADVELIGFVPEDQTEAAGILIWNDTLTVLLAGVG